MSTEIFHTKLKNNFPADLAWAPRYVKGNETFGLLSKRLKLRAKGTILPIGKTIVFPQT
jgi:hypothetical protein